MSAVSTDKSASSDAPTLFGANSADVTEFASSCNVPIELANIFAPSRLIILSLETVESVSFAPSIPLASLSSVTAPFCIAAVSTLASDSSSDPTLFGANSSDVIEFANIFEPSIFTANLSFVIAPF